VESIGCKPGQGRSVRRLAPGWLGVVIAAVAALSCARKPAPAGERPDSVASGDIRASITQQIGTAACTSPAVCRTLPLGVKPCGGPRQFLVYSLAVTDSARLARDAARFNEAEARKNRDQGMVSDCSMLMAPQVSCVSGKCAAVPSQARQPQ
jgi:hypothetical protein